MSDRIKLNGALIDQSAKAIQFRVDVPEHELDGKTLWWPKSQADLEQDHHNKKEFIVATRWIVDKKIQQVLDGE